jgi:hypothetical protein
MFKLFRTLALFAAVFLTTACDYLYGYGYYDIYYDYLIDDAISDLVSDDSFSLPTTGPNQCSAFGSEDVNVPNCCAIARSNANDLCRQFTGVNCIVFSECEVGPVRCLVAGFFDPQIAQTCDFQ